MTAIRPSRAPPRASSRSRPRSSSSPRRASRRRHPSARRRRPARRRAAHGLTERRRLGRPVRARVARRPVRDVRLDRGPGPDDPRPRGEEAGRPGRPRRRRHQEGHRRRLPQGQPAGPRRRERAAAQGPWAAAAGREPRRPLREAPRRAGRRAVQPRRQAALRRVALRQAGPDREDDVRPRVHPRAAGPELRPRVAEARRGGRGRQGDRGPVARRRRRDARHVALADPAPQPGGAAAAPQRVAQPRGLGQSRRDAGVPPRVAAVPVHGRPELRPVAPGERRLGRRQRRVPRPAGIDRAGPPSREVRVPRGAGRRHAAGGPADEAGPGLVEGPRGHARRVPAEGLARPGRGRVRRSIGGRRRRPAGAATG